LLPFVNDAILTSGYLFLKPLNLNYQTEANESNYKNALLSIQPLKDLIQQYQPKVADNDVPFIMEFILWALVELKQLSKKRTADGLSFNDMYDNLLKGLS
jgi:magnesium chelatase subunit I